jgi:hypothetical protein
MAASNEIPMEQQTKQALPCNGAEGHVDRTYIIPRVVVYARFCMPVILSVFFCLNILPAAASVLISEEGIAPGHSAEYVRTQSRNSSIDPDAVYYNPAGISFMQNGGIYIMVNSLNSYQQKSSSISLRGYQGINAVNNLNSPISSRYQSPTMYLSSSIVAMPSDLGFIFKRDNWAIFFILSSLRGQPGAVYTQSASFADRLLVAYNDVLASQMSQQLVNVYARSYLKRKELHIGATAGGSYAITDWLSSALAIRYINIQSNTRLSQSPWAVQLTSGVSANNFQVPTDINTDVHGQGAGIIVGFDVKPIENIIVAARIEYYPPMILFKKTNRFITNPVLAQTGQFNMFLDSIRPIVLNDRMNANGLGNIFNIMTMDPLSLKNISNIVKATYPPSFSVGFGYRPAAAVKLDTSVDLTFPRARDLDGRERDWDFIGYRVGQSIEWKIAPWVVISAGYSYHDFGIKLSKLTEYDDLLASHTVGAGCTFKPLEFLDVTAGSSYSFYGTAKNHYYDIINSTILGNRFQYVQEWNQKLARNEWCVSLGVTFSFYPVSEDRRKKAEEHYRKGMTYYLLNDIEHAIGEFKEAQSYNAYFRDVDKKVKQLIELQKIMKENIEAQKKEKGAEKKE